MEKRRYYQRAREQAPPVVARWWRLLGGDRGFLSGDKVLDLGCGRGLLGQHKPAPDIEVFGVDHDRRAVELAAAYEVTSELDFAREPLPFPERTFRAAAAKDVLEHVPDPLSVLGELRRVLVPGARVLVSVPMEFPWVVWNDYTHYRGFTRRALETMLGDAGFEVLEVIPIGAIPGAGRFGLVELIPQLLSLPPLRVALGRSWEAVARTPS